LFFQKYDLETIGKIISLIISNLYKFIMSSIIEIEFKGGRTDDCLNPMEFPFEVGDFVIVEVDNGAHLGRISYVGQRDKEKNPDEIQHKVLRKASREDITTYKDILQKERDAIKVCKQKVVKHGLPMKLVDVEYQFDMKKLTFYFTADGRVDFRELVKDLAAYFRVRIELRQIGVRDETKRLGGLGVCGLQLCCTTFLNCFNPITTQMAKIQNLSLNPQKLSGVCGRLKCCMKYELDFYLHELERYPTQDSVYRTEKGDGTVEKIDIFTDYIYLKYETGEWEKCHAGEFSKLKCIHCAEKPNFEILNAKGGENDCGKEHPVNIKQTGAPTESKSVSKEEADSDREQPETPFPSDLDENKD